MNDPARLMRFVLEMRQAGVTDARTLAALERTPRAYFAPPHLEALAIEDIGLPLGRGQAMTKPSIVGRVVMALNVGEQASVLEIGTGSGYQTAVIADLCRRVITLDRWNDFAVEANGRFGRSRLLRAIAYVGDGALGWPNEAPYDRIVFNCALDKLPEPVLAQLKPGGAAIAPINTAKGQRLIRFHNGERHDLGPAGFPPLEPGLGDAAAG
jgi:protein-L-isoaspartate(D-aspartate) O-methyltransferase